MVGSISILKKYWAVVAYFDKDKKFHIAVLQHDTDPDLQDEIILLQHHFGGLELLSDYTRGPLI